MRRTAPRCSDAPAKRRLVLAARRGCTRAVSRRRAGHRDRRVVSPAGRTRTTARPRHPSNDHHVWQLDLQLADLSTPERLARVRGSSSNGAPAAVALMAICGSRRSGLGPSCLPPIVYMPRFNADGLSGVDGQSPGVDSAAQGGLRGPCYPVENGHGLIEVLTAKTPTVACPRELAIWLRDGTGCTAEDLRWAELLEDTWHGASDRITVAIEFTMSAPRSRSRRPLGASRSDQARERW